MHKRRIPAFAAVSLMAILGGCARESTVLDNPPGNYEHTTKSTDAYGTTTKKTVETEVEVDEYGRKKATVETKTTTDPKGLFNKETTSESKKVIEQR